MASLVVVGRFEYKGRPMAIDPPFRFFVEEETEDGTTIHVAAETTGLDIIEYGVDGDELRDSIECAIRHLWEMIALDDNPAGMTPDAAEMRTLLLKRIKEVA